MSVLYVIYIFLLGKNVAKIEIHQDAPTKLLDISYSQICLDGWACESVVECLPVMY